MYLLYIKLVCCQRKKDAKIHQTTNLNKIVWKQAYQRILVYIIWAKLKKQEYQCILVYIIYA